MKKKILIVISHLELGGGAQKSAINLGNKLIDNGYEINYLTFYNVDNKYTFKGEELCLNEKFSNNIFNNIIKLFIRGYYIKKYSKNYDTILSFKEDANIPNIFSKVLFKNNSKVILSIRGSIDNNSTLIKGIIRLLYNYADKIVTIVKEETENLIKNYGINKSKVLNIYNMIDIEYIKNKNKEELGEFNNLFMNGKFSFINIGRFSEQKNHKLLLDSFEKSYKNIDNIQLILIGDGELKNNLQNYTKSLTSYRDIHFLGVHKNPYKFLGKSDVYVSSSSWEGLSRVLLEAMGSGLPIISTDHPTGAKELLKGDIKYFTEVTDLSCEEFGILVPCNDSDKLSEAMDLIFNNKKLRLKYKQKSNKRIKDFSEDIIVGKWKKVL